jgi:hypothetical protein
MPVSICGQETSIVLLPIKEDKQKCPKDYQ